MYKKFLVIFIALFCVSGAWAQLLDTKVKMEFSRDSLMIGDTLSLNLLIKKDLARDLSLPGFKDNRLTDRLEIIDGPMLDTLSQDERQVSLKIRYIITAFDAGNYIMDSFPLLEGIKEPFDTLYTRGVDSVLFTTFAVDTTKDVVYDIKPVLGAPYTWAEFKIDVQRYWWWVLIAVLFSAAVIIGTRFYKRRKRAIEEAQRALPPHEKAIMQLEKIRNKKLYQSGRYKDYFSEITDTLRVYLEERYGVQAMEMTSGEILRAIQDLDLIPKLQNSIAGLLALADMAKFARGVADADECEMAFFDACYFVENTREILIEEENEEVKK